VSENEYRQVVNRMLTLPTIRDIVGAPSENEGAGFSNIAFTMIEVYAGLGAEELVAVLLLSREVPTKMRMPSFFPSGNSLPSPGPATISVE